MSHEILKAKNEISMVLRGRKSIAPIFFPFLTLGGGQPSQDGNLLQILQASLSDLSRIICRLKSLECNPHYNGAR